MNDVAGVDVERIAIDPEMASRARTVGGAIVLMPVRYDEGYAVYAQSVITMVKRLRAAGLNAVFLDPPDQRTFEVRKGAIETAITTVALGMASSAAWDALKAFFRTRAPTRLSVTYVDLEDDAGQRRTAWKVDGDRDAVLETIDKLRRGESGISQVAEPPKKAPDADLIQDLVTASGTDDDLREAYRRMRIEDPRSSAQALMQSAYAAAEGSDDHSPLERAETDARKALEFFARSLDWAEDTDEEEEAHRLMDEAGGWVRRTFGCLLWRSGTEYRQRCPVALAHNRIGMSVGGTAVRVCSLCGEDFSECEHMPGTAYMVPGGDSGLGWCRVCLQESCDHKPTQQYRVSVIAIIKHMDVQEISLVPKPAHPEARVLEMGILVSDLQQVLGDDFIPGSEVSCDRCLRPCDGLVKHDAL
jgi:hypothetical protein